MIKAVTISKQARGDLQRVPSYIANKFLAWVTRVEKVGILEVRKVKDKGNDQFALAAPIEPFTV